jgi:hypothetical protein
MVTRIYSLFWLLLVASAALLYLTGNFSELTLAVFAFLFSALLFSGLVAVLPWWVDKQYSWVY